MNKLVFLVFMLFTLNATAENLIKFDNETVYVSKFHGDADSVILYRTIYKQHYFEFGASRNGVGKFSGSFSPDLSSSNERAYFQYEYRF